MNPQIKDKFYDLLIKEPTRENFRKLFQYNNGEQNELDFKEKMNLDAHLAKTILAMANTYGGLIVFGIKENGDNILEPCGLDKLVDKAKIDDALSKYLPANLDYEVFDFVYGENDYSQLSNKKFQVITVHNKPDRKPFLSKKTSDNKIEKDVVYIRRGTKCEKATEKDYERIVDDRINSIYRDSGELTLEQHLSQLKILYGETPKKTRILVKRGTPSISLRSMQQISKAMEALLGKDEYEEIDNPFYPEESYEEFIVEMIKQKKLRIKKSLDLF